MNKGTLYQFDMVTNFGRVLKMMIKTVDLQKNPLFHYIIITFGINYTAKVLRNFAARKIYVGLSYMVKKCLQ